MPTPSRAEITTAEPFPDDPGETVWEERRSVPLAAFFGVPAVLLALVAAGVDELLLRVVAGVLALVFAALLWRARHGRLIETFALTDRYLTIVQPTGGRVALPLETVERVALHGDEVRFDATVGTVTLGFVQHQRRLVQALERVAPGARIDRTLPAACAT